MTNDIQNPDPSPTPTRQALADLKESLTESLRVNGYDAALLARQAELLDRVFDLSLCKAQGLLENYHAHGTEAAQNWLQFALRAQKQCADSMKARATIDYMESLKNRMHRPAYLPRPRDE